MAIVESSGKVVGILLRNKLMMIFTSYGELMPMSIPLLGLHQILVHSGL